MIKKLEYVAPKLTVFGSVAMLTRGVGSANGDSGQGMMPNTGSDPRLKEDIVEVGRHPVGFGLYLFSYKPEFRDCFGHGRKFGVMADEVEVIVPDSVTIGADGYKRVNYARLGITFPIH